MQRATPSKKPVVERRPPVAVTIQRSAAVPTPSAAISMQQRIGNRATGLLIARSLSQANSSSTPVALQTGMNAVSTSAVAVPSLRVSKPTDPAEREAEITGRNIVRMREPEDNQNKSAHQSTTKNAEPTKLQKANGVGSAPSSNASFPTPVAGPAHLSGGSPLPPPVRRYMEPRFGADFGHVRIHDNLAAAQQSAQLQAHAFTVGSHIYFGQNQFQPQTDRGRELIAHELTHTIQQGAAVQRDTVHRSLDVSVQERSSIEVQRDLFELPSPRKFIADKVDSIPGFPLLTLILGTHPITGAAVPRNAGKLLRAVLTMIPVLGSMLSEALQRHGVFDRVSLWVETQFESLRGLGRETVNAIEQLIQGVSLASLGELGSLWNRAEAIFKGAIARIGSFAAGLASGIIQFIKDAILKPIAEFAQSTRGYSLLCSVLGRDPITGELVPQTPETLVGGFLKFINEEETWNTMQQAKALPRAYAWFQQALGAVRGFVNAIPGLFLQAFQALELVDILFIPRAFGKLASIFGSFAIRIVEWGAGAVWSLLEIIFDVVSPGALGYIKRTGAAMRSIFRNPLPFMTNLVRAAKAGFLSFADNFLTHLKAGLFDWLTGSLPGIYIPQAFSLIEIAKFVFSVLGLTWANIRQKLVKAVGEPAVKVLETSFDLVVTLVRDGPAAAWDKIKEQLANLKDMVIGGITDFVVDMVVQKAVPKLIAMFIPGAGFISAIITIYDTVMVFVNKISQMVQVVTGFIDSIVAIAAGQIGAAAQRVERTLATGLALAINFMAGFAGLGKVADKIMGVVNKVRAPIDKALDWLVNWIAKAAKKIVGSAKAGAKRLLNWFKKKVRVILGGEAHTLSLDGTPKNPKLVLRSTPEKPSLFLTKAAVKKKISPDRRAPKILETQNQENAIDLVIKQLAAIDDNNKAAASNEDANKADALATDLDSKMQILGSYLATILNEWGADDKDVTKLSLPRSNFTVEQKTKIAAQHKDKSQLRANSKGNVINLEKGLARRHVVSSHDMSKHYVESLLQQKKVSKCKLLLEQRGAIADAKVQVEEATEEGVQKAATTRYSRFFGYLRNIFIGDSRENSRIQENLDAGNPELAGEMLEDHVRHVKRAWALDQSMKISRLNED